MKIPAAGIAVLILYSSSLWAQWPKYKEAGAPRDAGGRVLMEGRTPRTPDGKPDLSGDWVRADRDPLPQELAGVVTARGETTRSGVVVEPPTPPFPPDPNSPPLATFFDIGANLAGGLPFKPSAAELKK